MLAAAERCVFHAICASVGGLRWFAPVTKAIPFEHVLPKREAPKGPPKGIVTGGPAGAVEFAVRLIHESGPQTLQVITAEIINARLATGSLPAIRGIVLAALLRSDQLRRARGNDRVERWTLRAVKPPAKGRA
jgi:hypothetical protein